MATNDSLKVTVHQMSKSRRKLLRTLAVLVPTLPALIGSALQYLRSHADSQTAVALSDSAPVGGHKSISFSDGSSVDLNTDAHMSAVISAKKRAVHLESGEAVFQVTSDRNRPFTVNVGHVQIQVLGTRFDVYSGVTSHYTGEQVTRIVVFEGAVQITRDDTSTESIIRLTAGDQVEIPDDRMKVAQLRHITGLEASRLTAWQDGKIEFEDRPLREILAEYARYQPLEFGRNPPEILNQHFTGVFQTNDLRPLLQTLEASCIRTTYKDGDQNIVLSQSPRRGGGNHCR